VTAVKMKVVMTYKSKTRKCEEKHLLTCT